MAVSFFESSPYAPLGISVPHVEQLVAQFVAQDILKLCVCLMDDDRAVGVLGAVAVQNIFNARYSCVEMMWWIDPEKRGYGSAKKMVEVYEYWARHKIDAQVIQLVTLDPTYSKFYNRLGFVRAEEAYIKEL